MIGKIDENVTVSQSSSPSPIHKQSLTRLEELVSDESQNQNLATPSPKLEAGQPSSVAQPGVNPGRSLAQILIVLVVVLVLVNIPVNYYGLGLAHIVPDSTTVAIYDGLMLKGSGPEIYLLEDHKLRWISSPEVRDRYFYSKHVRTIEDRLLRQFEQGRPIRRFVKCYKSPLVYAVENGQKRWVKDPPPEDKAKPWDRVLPVSCGYLQGLPDGLPIPEDAGPPPQQP